MPKYIVADAGYGSEQNYDDILNHRKREALITYNMYLKEQKKKYKQNKFHPDNWQYMKKPIIHLPIKRVHFKYHSCTGQVGFKREFKVYECENCTGCPLRSSCTKAKRKSSKSW